MKPFARSTVLAVATLLALSACKGENKPVDVSSGTAEAGKAATDKTGYPGLPTEKEQVSYTIGMAMGKQLSEIKDEVNVDTVVKALRTQMDGGKALYYPGGQLKFDEKGRRVGAGVTIVQWQNGVPVTVFPKDIAVADLTQGAVWYDGAGKAREFKDVKDYIGRRASAGRIAPRGLRRLRNTV